jgi:hypothetical protein
MQWNNIKDFTSNLVVTCTFTDPKEWNFTQYLVHYKRLNFLFLHIFPLFTSQYLKTSHSGGFKCCVWDVCLCHYLRSSKYFKRKQWLLNIVNHTPSNKVRHPRNLKPQLHFCGNLKILLFFHSHVPFLANNTSICSAHWFSSLLF